MNKFLPWMVGGAGLLLLAGRKQIVSLTGRIIQAGQEAAFAASLPSEAKPFANVILQVAKQTGLDPFLIAALGMRESLWGQALRSDGTGDCAPRTWYSSGVPVVGAGRNADGDLVYMPADGMCWGRGIMQVDYNSFYSWLQSNNWRDPYTNISKGASILLSKRNFLTGRGTVSGLTDGAHVTLSEAAAKVRGVRPGKYPDPRPLSGDMLVKATIAAYNTGEGNVLRSVAVGVDPDITTATHKGGGKDYGRDVMARLASMLSKFQSLTA